MRKIRSFWISVTLLLFGPGVFLVFHSVRTDGDFADAVVLLGGTLIGLALFALSMAIQQHIQLRATARHLHGPHHHAHTSKPADT